MRESRSVSRGWISATTLVQAFGLACLLMAGGCASLPPPMARPASHAPTDFARTRLARIADSGPPSASVSPLGAHELSGFRLLPEASFAFDARMALIRNAEKTVDVQYYLIQNDDIGLTLLAALRDASKRGVRVRLLIDDLYAAGEDDLLASLAAYPNVEVRLFNPLPSRAGWLPLRLARSADDLARINHRMHDKLMVGDNALSVSGGRNIANDYFMRSTAANYIDMDLLATGPVVREMSASFDAFWNSAQVRTIGDLAPSARTPAEARRHFDELASKAAPDTPLPGQDALGYSAVSREIDRGELALIRAPARLYADDPEKIERNGLAAFEGSVTQGVIDAFQGASKSLHIVSPYFIPGDAGMDRMRESLARGVKIVVVTNSLAATDVPLTYAGYQRYRAPMLRMGVDIHEIAPLGTNREKRSSRFGDFGKSTSRLHAKVAIIDDRRMFVGSMNLDHRSAELNTEMGVIVYSEQLAAEFERLVSAKNLDVSYDLRLDADGQVEWVGQGVGPDGSDIVLHHEPGNVWRQRLTNWLLLPLVGEDAL